MTTIHHAILCGNDRLIDELINKGADLNTIDKVSLKKKLPIRILCKDGNTLLHFAAEKGRKEVIKELIDRGADPNKSNDVFIIIIIIIIIIIERGTSNK